MTQITKHLDDLNRRISNAASQAGRNENEVSVLPVSKRHSVAAIRSAIEAGLTSMGENYLQEALEKIPEFGAEISWHYIGRIQSNKTRAIAENFQWVQTVSNEKVARRLSEQRPDSMPELNVCLQVCTDESGEHAGVMPEHLPALCDYVAALPGLRLRGLMTIPLPADSFEQQRIPFRLLKELFDEQCAAGHGLDTLSMGMSGDLEAAITEGSTMVRIGTALFGPRPG